MSKKSIALSADPDRVPVPKEDTDNGRRSIALSVNTEKLRQREVSNKSIGLSADPNNVPTHGQSKKSIALSANLDRVQVPKEDINNGRKSVALSVNTEKLRQREVSNKSIGLSADQNNVPTHGQSKKSVAISANPDRVPMHGDSKKSIALSVNTNSIVNMLHKKRTVALTVTPDKIKRSLLKDGFSVTQDPITEEDPGQDYRNNSRVSKSRKLQSNAKSRKSVALSISTNMGVIKEQIQSSIGRSAEGEDEDSSKDFYKPFVVRKDQGLSVITHTPTEKDGRQSIALSAITHTPTNKEEGQSENLSALHLSQRNIQEDEDDKSFRSAALSAVRVYEPKNFKPAPKQVDQAIEPWQQYQTDKSIQRTEVNYEDKSINPEHKPQSNKSISAMNKSVHEMAVGKSEANVQGKLIFF